MNNFFDLGVEPVEDEDEVQPDIDNAVWRSNADLSAAVNAFASAKATQLTFGVKSSSLPPNMDFLKDRTAARRLVTRKEQRAVVKHAFDISRNMLRTESASASEGKNAKQVVFALRGSPGIGKSWSSLLYFKLLLNDEQSQGRLILFQGGTDPEQRKTHLFVFDEKSTKWNAFELIGSKLPDEFLKYSNVDTVIDPAQFPAEIEPKPSALLESNGHIFIAVSPDDRHLGGTRKSSAATIQLVLGPWSLQEILVAWPLMFYKTNPLQAEYENRVKLVLERYHHFGGLPRYLLNDSKAVERKVYMTPLHAKKHSDLILTALTRGRIDHCLKDMVTIFFTMFPGVDTSGKYNPLLEFCTVEFVSYGALRAAGQTVFEKIQSDVVWRNATDASSVGLAFEAVALMFLHLGTRGMNDIGIQTQCRELLKDSDPRDARVELGYCPYENSDGSTKIVPVPEAANETEFFEAVRESGDTLQIVTKSDTVVLASQSPVSFPPPGLANLDGMSGERLGFQVTLQTNHPPSGASFLKQREELQIPADKESVIVFVVPEGRYREGWTSRQNFKWKENNKSSSEEEPLKKRRRGLAQEISVAASSSAKIIPQSQRAKAVRNLRQFVLSFNIARDSSGKSISAPSFY